MIVEYTATATSTLFLLLRSTPFKTKVLTSTPPRTKWTRKTIERVIKAGQTTVNATVVAYKASAISLGDIVAVDLTTVLQQQRQERLYLARSQCTVYFDDQCLLVLAVGVGVGAKHLAHFVLPELYGEAASEYRIVSRAYRAVAGLVLVAKSSTHSAALAPTLQMTFRCLCACIGMSPTSTVDGDFCMRHHGGHHAARAAGKDNHVNHGKHGSLSTPPPPNSACSAPPALLAPPPPSTQRTLVTVLHSVPSNSCTRLLLVDIDHLGSLPVKHQFRKQLARAKIPVVGKSTHPLKGINQNICQMLIRLSFTHPTTKQHMSYDMEPCPATFETIMKKEEQYALARLHNKETAHDIYQRGTVVFMNHLFHVTPSVLIPRESSSTLIAAAVQHLVQQHTGTNSSAPATSTTASTTTITTTAITTAQPHAPQSLHLLDLGTGSGCLISSLVLALDAQEMFQDKTRTTIQGYGVDLYLNALQVAQRNVNHHHLEDRITLSQGTFTRPGATIATNGQLYDIVLCNPPYRDVGNAKCKLDPSVLQNKEPDVAMIVQQGQDCLTHYRETCETCLSLLNRKGCGLLVFECPPDLTQQVQQMMAVEYGYMNVTVHKDQRGLARVVQGMLPRQ